MSVVLLVFLQNAFNHIRRVLANYNIKDWDIHQERLAACLGL
jgi:hypothetical protein